MNICLKVTLQEGIAHGQVRWARRPGKSGIFLPFSFEENKIILNEFLSMREYDYRLFLAEIERHEMNMGHVLFQ